MKLSEMKMRAGATLFPPVGLAFTTLFLSNDCDCTIQYAGAEWLANNPSMLIVFGVVALVGAFAELVFRTERQLMGMSIALSLGVIVAIFATELTFFVPLLSLLTFLASSWMNRTARLAVAAIQKMQTQETG